MKLVELLDMYLVHSKRYNSTGTYWYYKKKFKLVAEALLYLGVEEPEDIKDSFWDDFTSYMTENTNKKNNQINHTLSCLITVLRFYGYRYPKRFKLRDDTISFKVVSDLEISTVHDYVEKMSLKILNNISWILSIYIPLDTGCRITEMLNIKCENIDLETGSIFLDITKNNKNRYVFFGSLSEKYIKLALRQNKKYLMWNYTTGKRMDEYSVRNFYDRINLDLDFKQRIAPHRFRKTFATRLLKAGCPLTSISKLLGHSDIKQTMIYLEIDHELLKSDYQKYYPNKT